ncbi:MULTISPECIES: DegV family protein [unclassified Nocardioides]|uniref:DegV family protein n=1 Tax=unclassified Nocardioides TaxID=2615069 RepID=UPI000702DE32|nr:MULTISPECIES: DegV family protein [unclassified Nocardioides]KRC46091.1 fatty acid-binding protein DegV [Nocardioides sp. Root79]KRC69439.1 fatty acid-binding protein DegV [Nocardioides sp. Root240]
MPRSVALVTDSTAHLQAGVAESAGVTVVPLQVVIDDEVHDEGSEAATPERVAAALREKRAVSTSRPAPAVFSELYERLADEGASEIVSVHLSAEVSGTFESALVASRTAPVPVTCVDTRQVGVAIGYAVESAAAVLAAGGTTAEAAVAAKARSASATSLFYVNTLEYLRRGGRVGAAAAVFGGVLAVKPLLGIVDGVIAPRAKVRTAAKAIAQLEAMALEAAGEQQVEICVAHLAAEERALALAERLGNQLGDQLVPGRDGSPVRSVELGGVLGAHVGPGMLAICVAPVLS